MNEVSTEAARTLRWGGRAGIAGSLIMLFTFGFVAVFVGMDITPVESLTRFRDISAARAVENTLYLGVLLLWLVHVLALHRALRRTNPTPALLGAVLNVVGLAVLAAGALPHLATAPISDLYHAAEATAQDRHSLVLLWQGIEAVFDALLGTGLVIVPLGVVALGQAMLGDPGYGTRSGRIALTLGAIGLMAAAAVLAGVPEMAGAGVLALAGFHLVVGWRTLALARRGGRREGSVSSSSQVRSGFEKRRRPVVP